MKKIVVLLAFFANLALSGCVGGSGGSSSASSAGSMANIVHPGTESSTVITPPHFSPVGSSFYNPTNQLSPIVYDKLKNQIWHFGMHINSDMTVNPTLCFISAQAASTDSWDCDTVKLPQDVHFDIIHLLASSKGLIFMVDIEQYVWTYDIAKNQFTKSMNPINYWGNPTMPDSWTIKDSGDVIYATVFNGSSSDSLYTLDTNTGDLSLSVSRLFPDMQMSLLGGIAVVGVESNNYVYGIPMVADSSNVYEELIGSSKSNTFGILPANTAFNAIATDDKNLYVCGMDKTFDHTSPQSSAVFSISLNQPESATWTSLGAVISINNFLFSCSSITGANSSVYVSAPAKGDIDKSQLYRRAI